MITRTNLLNYIDNGSNLIKVAEVELELHGIFWFHSYAQPRDKYIHITLPLIHNYPLTLAFLGLPVESSYASVGNLITKRITAQDIWKSYGFYIYPAIAERSHIRTFTFSMGGTGYVAFKPKTRASVPDYTANQVFLPGSKFRTYVLLNPETKFTPPRIVRLGSKRFGVFYVKTRSTSLGTVKDYVQNQDLSHPFNVRECPSKTYYGILQHYAGNIAFSGIPLKIISTRNITLAAPSFV